MFSLNAPFAFACLIMSKNIASTGCSVFENAQPLVLEAKTEIEHEFSNAIYYADPGQIISFAIATKASLCKKQDGNTPKADKFKQAPV